MDESSARRWERAARIDASLAFHRSLSRALAARELRPVSYSRRRLFRALARQEAILFRDFPVRAPLHAFFREGAGPEARLKSLFGRQATTLVKAGVAQKRKHVPVHDVVDAWQRSRGVLSANDVFFRDLGLDRVFDCGALSDFNILCGAPGRIRDLEVATLLMGTVGAMSDSHSDDPDGCNHCVLGTKLWCVWDRGEGRKHGLEDCEYDDVYTRARFSVKAFLSVRSARWFVVSAGRTLFMPGNLTHKVITLERYLGISSFYVALPNALSTLARWTLQPTRMATPQDRDTIAELVSRRLRATAAGDRRVKHQWGYYWIEEALDSLASRCTPRQKEQLRAQPRFTELAAEMAALCGRRSPFA